MTFTKRDTASKKILLALAGLTLVSLVAACDGMQPTGFSDPDAEATCQQEGFDPGTTEFENCMHEVSTYNREEE